MYNMVRGGTTAQDYLVEAANTTAAAVVGDEVTLPASVTGVFASGNEVSLEVTWKQTDLEEAVYSGEGVYPIAGTATYGEETYDVICTLTLTGKNYLVNPSFEDALDGNWETNTNIARKNSSGGNNNMRTGNYNLHFWLENGGDIAFSQTIILDAGTYRAGGYAVGTTSDAWTLTITVGTKTYEKTVNYGEWGSWVSPEISDIVIAEDGTEVTVSVASTVAAGSWGAFEDFYEIIDNYLKEE